MEEQGQYVMSSLELEEAELAFNLFIWSYTFSPNSDSDSDSLNVLAESSSSAAAAAAAAMANTTTLEVKTESECEQCSICLDNYTVGTIVRQLPCGHKFHDACVSEWINKPSSRRNCPL